jgi:hypothetical protein
MAGNPMAGRHVAQVLERCRIAGGLSLSALADCMIAKGFPAHEFTGRPPGTPENLRSFVTLLDALEQRHEWLFSDRGGEFVEAAASCMPGVFQVAARLDYAIALDALEEVDP